MFRLEQITKDWREAGSLPARINLYGFWDEHAFLTKSGDLGAALQVGGIHYQSCDQRERDYAVKRMEAALRTLGERMRLYQILFKHNRPTIAIHDYNNPLVQAAVETRARFLQAKADQLYTIEIFWVLMIDGSCRRQSWLHALRQCKHSPRRGLQQLLALGASDRERTFLYEEIARDRLRLEHELESLSGQLTDLTRIELLGAEETFRFFRRLVNFRPFKIHHAPFRGPAHLDRQVCDSELEAHRGYLRSDDHWVRVLTLKELPGETRPLLLNGILDVRANFHVVTEWHPISNQRARQEIHKRRRHYHNSKTSFLSNLQDRHSTGPRDELVDDSKEAAIAQLGDALTALEIEGSFFGEFTLSVVIYDEDQSQTERAMADFQKLFTAHDGLLYPERFNLLNAFFATIPGNRQFNLRRQWALHTNYADLSFLFTVDRGARWNPHLEAEYLAVLETAHATPYYLNLHAGDVAHTLVLGATGSGKSFLLNFLVQSLEKYQPLTFIFDLGASYETLTRGFRGAYLNVGPRDPGFTINPFSLEPTDDNLNFLYLFLKVLIESNGRYRLAGEDEKTLFTALERIYRLPAEMRTLSNLASILGPLAERLHRWTGAGQFGYLFDNAADTLTWSQFQTFNFDGWAQYPDLLEPLLFYILGRASAEIEKKENTARFKVFVIDEAWMFLKNPAIREWITRAEKTWRKKNAAMILATQSVVELETSQMLPVVNESCPTRIFLANPNIDRRVYADIFQLNDTELELLEGLRPKHDLLLLQPGSAHKLVLEVDSLSYWISTNNARDNLRRREYFARFGAEAGLVRLAHDYPHGLKGEQPEL